MATKACPDCAEQVQANAKLCRHCGHDFDAPEAPTRASNSWAIAMFAAGVVATVVGLVTRSQELTLVGLIVGALGGYIWRFRIRRARALR
jgi:Flp pilus assembly protein TadB